MSIPPTNRLAGAALVTGGLAWSLSYWLRDAAGDATSGGLVAAAIVTGVLGVVTVMLGLPGWYAAQADRARWAGLVAFVLVFTALPILEIGSLVFAAAQPGLGLGPEAEFETATALAGGLFVYGLAGTNLGLVFLGFVTWRAKVLPRPAAAMVALGPLLIFAPVDFAYGEAVALSVCFLGISWIGWALGGGRTDRSETASRPATAMV
jgi:hypothetical protein